MATEEELIVQNTVSTNIGEVVGQGIDFPLHYVAGNTVGMSSAGERIKDSIHVILSTRIGERMWNPEFGSRVPELVFEPNDEILKKLLNFYTVEALKRWEKRIDIISVVLLDNYQNDKSTVGVHIEYTIHNSHVKGSYVFPFVREGMPTDAMYTGVEQDRMMNAGSIVE